MSAPNSNIYNVNYQGVETNLTPPNHRTPVWLAWLKALLYPLQWLHNNFFMDYANGSSYDFYNYSTIYDIGDRVIDIDNAVYECEVSGFGGAAWSSSDTYTTGNYATYNNQLWQSLTNDNINHTPGADTINWQTMAPHLNSNLWWQVSPDYRGVRTRTMFNSQKLVLEGILNQYFRTTFRQPPYMQITSVVMQGGGIGYTKATAILTGANGSGIDAVLEPVIIGGVIIRIDIENPGFGYLSPLTVTITGDGTGAKVSEVLMEGNPYPDIFIDNNIVPNTVFVVGYNESESSAAVYGNGEAIDFVESIGSDYNFDANDFTIFVPESFYNTETTGVGSIVVTKPGSGYSIGSPPSVTLTGGGGTGATATALVFPVIKFVNGFPVISVGIIAIIINNPGTGYTSPPTVTISGSGGAAARAVLATSPRDNIIRSVANKYVIAGMNYNIETY